jgi:hypothetical protein
MLKKMKPVGIIICGLIVVFALITCNSKGETSISWRPDIDLSTIPVDPGFIIEIYDSTFNPLSNGASTTYRAAFVYSDPVPNPDPSSTISFNGQVWIFVNDLPTQATVYTPEPFDIFEQPISLRSGTNTIVAVIFKADGSGYGKTETWTITGTFANPLYRAQLTWDTPGNDVDIHLLRNDLWGDYDNHCYYWNDFITGMAGLDYDDVDGYGPENMSIETTAPAGNYKVLVKYYWGEVTVNAAVQIFDQNDALISTYTHVFTADDVSVYDESPEATDWVVTTLTVP